jgi:hypothetical protein
LRVLAGQPVAISPDDATLLLSRPGYVIDKFLLANMTDTSLGPDVGQYRGVEPAQFLFTADSRTVYVVGINGEVHEIDVASMTRVGDPITYDPGVVPRRFRLHRTFAALSPDDQYIVINTGGSRLNVVDLSARRSTLVDAPGVRQTHGLGFNYANRKRTLLAVHGEVAVAVYEFHRDGATHTTGPNRRSPLLASG